MRIFLSFPSELESTADQIAQSLRNRDYDVFFSHDDLPPADSFDLRVESAILKSDFMVFLISPESVTRGRYTLTEMGFARSKWPNPSRRVLPVMAAPTPLESVPNYLKAVTILEPEGNIAAETRAAVDRILQEDPATNSSGNIPLMLILSIMALVSAIGSYLANKYSPDRFGFSFIGGDVKAPVLPGVMFGAVVAICSAIFGLRDRFQLGLVILVTTAAWIAAFDTSSTTNALLNQYSKTIVSESGAAAAPDSSAPDAAAPAQGTGADTATPADTPPSPTTVNLSNNPLAVGFLGLVGGAVGGAITILGLLITSPSFRRLDSVMVCWATATVAGAVLGITQSFFVLFAVWQIAVILTIARGFSPAPAQLPRWLGRLTASASFMSRSVG
jgi:TIR domain